MRNYMVIKAYGLDVVVGTLPETLDQLQGYAEAISRNCGKPVGASWVLLQIFGSYNVAGRWMRACRTGNEAINRRFN